MCDVFYIQFHLEQAKLRSKIRIEHGRGMTPFFVTLSPLPHPTLLLTPSLPPFSSHYISLNFIMSFSSAKPIDLLAKYVNATDDDIEMQEPYLLLIVTHFHQYNINTCINCYNISSINSNPFSSV